MSACFCGIRKTGNVYVSMLYVPPSLHFDIESSFQLLNRNESYRVVLNKKSSGIQYTCVYYFLPSILYVTRIGGLCRTILIAHDMTLTEGESGGGHIDVKRGTLSMGAPLIAKNTREKKLSLLEILQNYMTPLGNSKVIN